MREGHLASQTWVAGERVASWALRKGLGALGAWTALSDRRVLCGAFPIVSALFLPSVPPNTASSARSPLPPSRSQRGPRHGEFRSYMQRATQRSPRRARSFTPPRGSVQRPSSLERQHVHARDRRGPWPHGAWILRGRCCLLNAQKHK